MGNPTLQHICKAHKTLAQSQPCKRAAIANTRQTVCGATLNKPYKIISRKFALVKHNKSIQLKAAFLLTVFSLNIVIGFACSVGIDMGFNKHHHEEEKNIASASGHHHEEEITTDNNQISFTPVENCCNQKVIQLAQTDKAVPQADKLINPIFATAFIASFYNADVSYWQQQVPSIKHFVRSYHPPISDIRIAIQSFLI